MFSLVNALSQVSAFSSRATSVDLTLTSGLGEPRGPGVLPFTCKECQAVLDMYISDEMDGRDAQRDYPLVYQHLQSCPDCSALYVDVRLALRANLDDAAAPEATRPRARPSFPRHPTDLPWLVRPLAQLGGRLEGVVFILSQAHVQAALWPAGAAARYEHDLPPSLEPHLLLLDTVMLGQETLTVEITATATLGRPDHLVIRGLMSGPSGIEPGLHAILRWLGQTRQADVTQDGRVEFGAVVVREADLASDQAGLQIALTRPG